MKFDLSIGRFIIRGYFLHWSSDDMEFGCSLWFGWDKKDKKKKVKMGFQG